MCACYWTECLFEIDMIRGPFRENLVQSVWENGTGSCWHFQAITVRVVCMYILCFQKRFSNYLFEKETCEVSKWSCDSKWVCVTAFKINLVSYSTFNKQHSMLQTNFIILLFMHIVVISKTISSDTPHRRRASRRYPSPQFLHMAVGESTGRLFSSAVCSVTVVDIRAINRKSLCRKALWSTGKSSIYT